MELFYKYVDDAYNYDDKERMEDLYSLKKNQMCMWVYEKLEEMEVPSYFASCIIREWKADNELEKLWDYIQDICRPEEEEEEEVELPNQS
jgi:hypothetical protein